jgi:hypothetical protein
MEPRVRIWWLAGSVLLVIALGWTLRQYLAWNQQASLVREGTKLEATVWQTQDWGAGKPITGRRIQPGVAATLAWKVEGKEYSGRHAFTENMLSGMTAPVWVAKDNPAEWTADPNVPPLGRELVALLVLAPAVVLSLAAAALARRNVLNLWKNGDVHQAVAVDAKLSAFSPLSRQVRCSLLDVPDKRLLTVTIPGGKGVPAKGGTFYVLTPPGQVSKAVAARSFA